MTTEWKRDATGYYKEKSPTAKLDYGHDWTDWAEDADTISTSTWVNDTGITRSGDAISGLITYAYFNGGTAGARYSATNTVTWASGRISVLSFGIVVKDM
jgi:hypothetical protein